MIVYTTKMTLITTQSLALHVPFSMRIAPERSSAQSPPDGFPRGSMNVGRDARSVSPEMVTAQKRQGNFRDLRCHSES